MVNEKFKQARLDKNLSQGELAKQIGVSRQTINMIENGDYNPTISLCIKMPYSCTSNFRYIAYISLGMIVLYSLVLENIKHKKLYDISYFILGIFSMASSLFILFI